ncbi:MAG: TIGR00730 family Rossman fold protein [Tannerella sp.]|jgi:uncharacterized protein (TIGR00730 family)|nr:TIGR00730 family Rossman fold protein [Tannerella sp.]
MTETVSSVCIYCASSERIRPVYREAAEKLGRLLGKAGAGIINGAGSEGLMRAVSDAALEAGGRVTGVIPRFMVHSGWCHPGLTELIVVETMHERKQRMAELSDAAIALPGGFGTLEELLEIITWQQLGLYRHPVVILNTNGYYDPLLRMFQQAADEGFIPSGGASSRSVARTPEEAMEMILPALLK